jgi:hypothetical protein
MSSLPEEAYPLAMQVSTTAAFLLEEELFRQ